MRARTRDAYQLMHDGALALADVEENGICIDIKYCERMRTSLAKHINELKDSLDDFDEAKLWRKIFGRETNFASPKQMSRILFDELEIKSKETTAKGRPSVKQSALEKIGGSFLKTIIRIRKLEKCANTYLPNIIRETVDGIIHPFFNLHLVVTYRSQSDHVNFQNFPIRDKEQGKIIRSAVIPRKGHMLVEFDFSGLEVNIAACYHKDPSMITYINDNTLDMHRDAACDCFLIDPNECTKEIRFAGKSGFVFPQFYGDYYINCARYLWEHRHLKPHGSMRTLQDVLRKNGIKTQKQFESHIRDVEDDFWHRRFRVYNQWRDDFFNEYKKRGYIDTLTGFRCSGPMKKNEVINYPVQGSAFHCLLWSLIECNAEMKAEKMRSKIVGQIHDSILIDVHEDEFDDVIDMCHKTMTEDVRREWLWINVPLNVEAEITKVDANWFTKTEIEL